MRSGRATVRCDCMNLWRQKAGKHSLFPQMQTYRTITSCRICSSSELAPVISLGEQALTGVFPRTASEPVSTGPLDVVKCLGSESCGLVQLRHTYESSEMYGPRYGYRSSLNRAMVDHLSRKIAGLQLLVDLRPGDLVVDIGSNDGTSLSFYPEHLERAGIDPTAAQFLAMYGDGITVIPDFFSGAVFDTAFGGRKAKIITSIAMLYDLERPVEFARQIHAALDRAGIWHFEQSYLPTMLATTAYDTICHEHVEYYGLAQIDWILQRAGLRIVDVELNDVNGGSFAVTACRDDSPMKGRDGIAGALLASEADQESAGMQQFDEFAGRVRNHRESLVALLNRLSRDDALTLGYGASTKGNVILQYCGIGPELVPYFAEVNREKVGSFTPGSLIPIIGEDEARAMRPQFFLAMPWHFRNNLIMREAEFLASGGRMIFPLPKIDIVAGQAR